MPFVLPSLQAALYRDQHAASHILKELLEFGARQDCLCLSQCFDLLVASGLTEVKILQDEIARRMQFSIVVGELLKLDHHGFLFLLGLNQISFCLSLGLRLVDNVFALRLNACIRLLDKILVCLLGIFFGPDGFCLHCFSVIDDLLDHTHHSSRGRVFLVGFKAWGRGRSSGLLPLNQCSGLLLAVKVLQNCKGSLQQFLRCTLICHRRLEFLVFLLPIFTCSLQLHLHLSDLSLQSLNRLRKLINGHLQVFDLCNEIFLLSLFFLSFQLVFVELVDAEVFVFDLIGLLNKELRDHIINGLFDSCERIESHTNSQCCETRALRLLGNISQELGSS